MELVAHANLVSFTCLESFAFDHRAEPKDAHDLVYCLEHADGGVDGATDRFKAALETKHAGAIRSALVQAPPGTEGVLGEVIDTKWLDTPAAAAFLGHTVGTLQTYRWMGTGPRFRRIGRRTVYAMGDLEAWRKGHAELAGQAA